MIRALSAAVSGIESDQTMMDVIGDNIANADTPGYASVNVEFSDLLDQQLAGASGGSAAVGGANPQSVGSGTRVAATTTSFAEGSLQQTGSPTDLAIQGAGFLVAQQNGATVYTRAGSLTVDALGHLVTTTGGLVQGWAADAVGNVNTNGPTTALTVAQGQTSPPSATTTINIAGNLKAWSGNASPQPYAISTDIVDALGSTVPVAITLTPVAGTPGAWTMQATVANPAGGPATSLWNAPQQLQFTNGQLAQVNATPITGATQLKVDNPPAGYTWPPAPYGLHVDLPAPGTTTSLTQLATADTATATQNGITAGTLHAISIGPDGTISGAFSSGATQALGRIALASFDNPDGLLKVGGGCYQTTLNSGNAQVGLPGTGGRGTFQSGALEMSNVDLAKQLTDLITAQNAYQANTKVVAASNQVLQALVNMP